MKPSNDKNKFKQIMRERKKKIRRKTWSSKNLINKFDDKKKNVKKIWKKRKNSNKTIKILKITTITHQVKTISLYFILFQVPASSPKVLRFQFVIASFWLLTFDTSGFFGTKFFFLKKREEIFERNQVKEENRGQ